MEEHGEIHEAFRLVSAIKEIVQCRSSSALESLKNVIDDRLNELDGIEQNTDFAEQTGVKIEQIPSEIEQKKKTRHTYERAVYPEDQIMGRYGTTTVYKPVVDVILKSTPDRFSRLDVAKIIDKHYNFTLDRTITAGSARSYASFYIKCMLSKGLIKEDGPIGYHMMFKKCTTVQKKDPSISEEKGEGDSRENGGLKKQINENRQFLNEVCS